MKGKISKRSSLTHFHFPLIKVFLTKIVLLTKIYNGRYLHLSSILNYLAYLTQFFRRKCCKQTLKAEYSYCDGIWSGAIVILYVHKYIIIIYVTGTWGWSHEDTHKRICTYHQKYWWQFKADFSHTCHHLYEHRGIYNYQNIKREVVEAKPHDRI